MGNRNKQIFGIMSKLKTTGISFLDIHKICFYFSKTESIIFNYLSHYSMSTFSLWDVRKTLEWNQFQLYSSIISSILRLEISVNPTYSWALWTMYLLVHEPFHVSDELKRFESFLWSSRLLAPQFLSLSLLQILFSTWLPINIPKYMLQIIIARSTLQFSWKCLASIECHRH